MAVVTLQCAKGMCLALLAVAYMSQCNQQQPRSSLQGSAPRACDTDEQEAHAELT